MRIHFEPSQLEAAESADAFVRLVDEMVQDTSGEIRVMQNFRGEPTRLILISSGLRPVSLEVPHRWLYQRLSDEEMRSRLTALFEPLGLAVH